MIVEHCDGCKHMGSDSCRDVLWYICVHPDVLKITNDDGKGLLPDLERPLWCPLTKG